MGNGAVAVIMSVVYRRDSGAGGGSGGGVVCVVWGVVRVKWG